jgi:hypothetical protein
MEHNTFGGKIPWEKSTTLREKYLDWSSLINLASEFKES